MSDKKQQLVLSILDFLTESIKDGSVKADDKEGVEVAVQCIGEAFGVDPNDASQVSRLSVKPATLQSIFDVYLKTRSKAGSAQPEATTSAPPKSSGPSSADKAKAEQLKQTGNAQMSARAYSDAVESYEEAIKLDPTNPVYLSNLAAAYSSLEDYDSAKTAAEKAIDVDPTFVKAYSRLGHACYSQGDYSAAVDAFQRGLALDPTNANLRSGLENAKDRIPSASTNIPTTAPAQPTSRGGMPDLASMASMMGGMGGGAGGMPDLASFMNNPAMMQMAQQLMASGGLDQIMQNPTVQQLANRMQSGEGMPSQEELLNDPSLRDLASSFLGGAGRGAGGAPGAGR